MVYLCLCQCAPVVPCQLTIIYLSRFSLVGSRQAKPKAPTATMRIRVESVTVVVRLFLCAGL